MRVNSIRQGIIIVMLAIFVVASAFTEHRDLPTKQVNLMIRKIGHRLLLQAGDSTSRVLPVVEIEEGTFQLSFENEFSFSHDSLVMLSQDLLPKEQFPSGYTVTVHEGGKSDIVYGFRVSDKSSDADVCVGRSQPFGRYTIEIAFANRSEQSYSYGNLIFSGLLVLLGISFLIGHLGKTLKPAPGSFPSLGKFSFDVKGRRLLLAGEVITLTDKECRVLELLSENFGELISRETLMEKIWINEGVITGRSLDMFVSKLRKKLSPDPELRITNVHGKGYKLEK